MEYTYINSREFRVGNIYHPTDGSNIPFKRAESNDIIAWNKGAVYGKAVLLRSFMNLDDLGFTKTPFHTYEINVSPFKRFEKKVLIVDMNQGILIRQGEREGKRIEDDLVVLVNFDIRRNFCVHNLQNLYEEITGIKF